MKKSNIITVIVLLLAVASVSSFYIMTNAEDTVVDLAPARKAVLSSPEIVIPKKEELEKKEEVTTEADLSDALFIGDSRTVGIMEYAGLDGTDFFCDVGMNVFNVCEKKIAVPNVGKFTLTELLSKKSYGKIYIMLGINEVGYNFKSILGKYSELIELLEEKQPNVRIFIMANLHVAKNRSDTDKIINNNAIDRLNARMAELANGKNRFYLDANVLFDDADGNLSADKTGDNVHLYAKYYAEWGKWIAAQTAEYVKEEKT